MRQTIQLYIDSQRVDMFDDESVDITQTIKNIRDIQKVFTDFTRQFTLPASSVNNRIFKHYYNYHITNGYDGRKKSSANIEINHMPFRKGKLKLDGVVMKDNAPYAYKVTFFGNTIDLKDLIAEDKLSDLDFGVDAELDSLRYNPSTIESKLSVTNPDAVSAPNIICPLITHTQVLYYNDGIGHGHETDGNLHYDSGTGHDHGVKWNQLKFAIRLNRIITAIENTYGITFSSDFFKDSTNKEFFSLFMWLHKSKGHVQTLTEDYEYLVNNFTASTSDQYFHTTPTYLYGTLDGADLTSMTLTIDVNASYTSTDYKVRITRNDNTIYQSGILNGDQVFTEGTHFNYTYGLYKVYIQSSAAAFVVDAVDWDITYNSTSVNFTTSSAINVADEIQFNVPQNIPNMKVMDFLSTLFKMFNLVAEVEDDGTIYVDTYDNYYANKRSSSDPYDITKYIDISEGSVDVALPYNEIVFKYKDTKTVLANKYGEIVNKSWGEVRYSQREDQSEEGKISGDAYTVEIPFHHMQFERLKNLDDETYTSIMYGLFVDDDLNPYLGSPLIFYANRVFTGAYSFADGVDPETEEITSHKSLSYANIPSNSLELSTVSTSNIHFTEEVNEYTTQTGFTGSLFENYYKNYIQDLFRYTNRLTKVTAYLPVSTIVNYRLADRFKIVDRVYKINSIKTNLLSGKSEIELIND